MFIALVGAKVFGKGSVGCRVRVSVAGSPAGMSGKSAVTVASGRARPYRVAASRVGSASHVGAVRRATATGNAIVRPSSGSVEDIVVAQPDTSILVPKQFGPIERQSRVPAMNYTKPLPLNTVCADCLQLFTSAPSNNIRKLLFL